MSRASPKLKATDVIKYLNEESKIDTCPVCGGDNLAIEQVDDEHAEEVFIESIFNNEFKYPAFLVICTSCGHFMLFGSKPVHKKFGVPLDDKAESDSD